MRPIAVINQKGGVGKTTTTANLGAALARAGSRVLLIDLDPQGHLSLHFGAEPADGQPSIYDVLTSHTPLAEVTLSVGDNLSLVPADIDLAGAEMELVSITGREVLLREALVPAAQNHDFLLIDCPPSLGILTVNALVAATHLLVPIQSSYYALEGTDDLLDTYEKIRARPNPDLKFLGVVITIDDKRTILARDIRKQIQEVFGDKVFKTTISKSVRLEESPAYKQSIFSFSPSSSGAAEYYSLSEEVIGRV